MPRPKPNKDALIKEYITKYGYTVLDDGEKDGKWNVCSQLKVKCHKNPNHIFNVCLTDLKRGKKDISEDCPHCKNDKKNEELGIHKSIVEKYAKKYNVDYYPKKEYYNRWGDSITFTCKEDGFEIEIKALAHWEKNQKPFVCKECIRTSKGLLDEKEYEEKIKGFHNIKHVFTLKEKVDYETLTPRLKERIAEQSKWNLIEFNGTRNKCVYQCVDCGYEKECYPSAIFNGRGFGCCSCKSIEDKKRVSESLKVKCKNSNLYILDDKFVHTKNDINFKCNKCGQEFKKPWNKINRTDIITCPSCFKSTKRKSQTEIANWVKSFGIEIQEDIRSIIPPYELDIFIPGKNIAIEYCGNIWHSDKFKGDKNYHKKKFDLCESKGIRLITIFEDEWVDLKDICKSRLKNALGLIDNRIYARNCSVKEISNKEALQFCKENHIQGKGSSSYSLGLFHEGELVSVMTFSKPSVAKGSNSKSFQWELNRFCNKLDTVVVGSASKLFSYFKKENKGEVISYCDLRWGNGGVYSKIGMNEIGFTRPNYYYIGSMTDWKRKHRFNFTKKKLIELGGDPKLTEFQIADSMGLNRVYDCGHRKYSIVI